MRRSLFCALGALLLLYTPTWSRDDSKSDKTPNFVGNWRIISGEKAGEKEPAERIEGITVRITKDTIVVVDKKDKKVYAASYVVDLTKRPHPITMTETEGPKKGDVARGIIQFQDDTLKLCYAVGGDKAPTEFATRKGMKELLFVMKKAK
jgi:uncharacterized protein (TIGR03067 family)